jgi:hypothetical protein
MAFAQDAQGWSRPLTTDERAKFEKWRAALLSGRTSIARLVSAGACCSYAEQFRTDNAPHLAPVITTAQAEHLTKIIGKWNRTEEIFAGCEMERFGIQIDKGDIMVFAAPGEREPGAAVDPSDLGVIWFVVIGVVLIVSAIVTTTAIDYAAQKDENKLKSQFADLSAKMAKEPPDVRAAYEAFLKSSPMAEEKSIWDKLAEGVTGALSMVAIGVLAFFLIKTFAQARGSSSSAPARISNPCGGATASIYPAKKGGWSKSGKIRWSDDPARRRRQAQHIEDAIYGGPGWVEDEVPF